MPEQNRLHTFLSVGTLGLDLEAAVPGLEQSLGSVVQPHAWQAALGRETWTAGVGEPPLRACSGGSSFRA